MRRLLLPLVLLVLVIPAASAQTRIIACNAPKPQCQPPVEPPPSMGRLITAGAEVRGGLVTSVTDTFPEGASVGAQVAGILDSTAVSPNPQPRSGSAHWKALRNTGGTCMVRFGFTGATGTSYFARFYPTLNTDLSSLPQVGDAILAFTTAGSTTPLAGVKIDSIDASGNVTVGLYVGSTLATQVGSSSAPFNIAAYGPRVELKINVSASAGADDAAELQVDGVSVASTSTATIGTTAPGGVVAGFVLATGTHGATLFFDDVAVNDSTGAAQTSWPGSGKVVLLVPTSDNARTGCTTSSGATTSLFAAVDNTPPLGIADTAAGSATAMIRDAVSSATDNYDANMTTYTAAGIGASDTINVEQWLMNHGAASATSPPTRAGRLVSNPAEGADTALTTPSAATGTYPSNWIWNKGTPIYSPAVTLGTAPVLRVGKRTASTRVVDVDFMGIYVDYTPAVVVARSLIFADRRVARNSLLRR